MEISWLIERLNNPSLLKKGEEHQLRELIASYPYFSAPYLLLAKCLKVQNHPAFDDLLPLISLQAHDRKLLFRLVNEELVEKEVVKKVEVEEEKPEQVTSDIESGSENENHVAEELESQSQHIVSVQTSRFAVDLSEVEKEEESAAAEYHEMGEIPFLVDVHRVEPIATATIEKEEPFSYAPADEAVVEEEENEVESFETAQSFDSAQDDEEVVEKKVEKNELEEKELAATESEKTSQIEKTDFIHWLTKLTPLTKGEVTQAEVQTQIPDQMEIIDKFIETKPSVSRVKEKFYDPTVQARESERLDDSLITETMARIYVRQHKFDRAIEAYMKLQLKYPGKSDYFAGLIEEVNSKKS